jgi:hypothetical protein
VLGLTVGTLGALGLTRLAATMLYGVRPHDPATFAVAAALLAAVALAASYLARGRRRGTPGGLTERGPDVLPITKRSSRRLSILARLPSGMGRLIRPTYAHTITVWLPR